MRRVPAAAFSRQFSLICDEAMIQPVIMTRNGRDRLVMVSAVEFRQILSLAAQADQQTSDARKLSNMLEGMI